MFGTLVVVAMEASIITLQGGTAIMLQMQKTLRADKSIRSEADLVRVKFAALQRAFKDAFSIIPKPQLPKSCVQSFLQTTNAYWLLKGSKDLRGEPVPLVL
jgi:hypothetical protein